MRRLLLLLLGLALWLPSASLAQDDVEAQTLFLSHLQAHFDDIHDVVMRFHREHPLLEGQVSLRLVFEDGRMVEGEIAEDQTGDERIGLAFLEALRAWTIPGLDARTELLIPFATRIVGRDDISFPEKAILTGRVTGTEGDPVAGALVELQPESGRIRQTRTNREGIYILTLIDPGRHRLFCTADGYAPMVERVDDLGAGRHRLLDLVLSADEGP